MKKFRTFIVSVIVTLIRIVYRRSIPHKVRVMRSKPKIKVLFVLSETSKWKTEALYKAMARHHRFEPIIGITFKTDDKPSESARKLFELMDYLDTNNYPYLELIREGFIKENIAPDIIIYQEPYVSNILRGHNLFHNLNTLFISITYGYHSVLLPFNHYADGKLFAWFDCYENKQTAKDAAIYTKGKRKNILVTGLPQTDSLFSPPHTQNSWKESGDKKKIIWAPHHSIGFDYESITYGNFLNIATFMQELAVKYRDRIHWAFKPHPLLKYKLELLWGKEKTETYYKFWQENDFTQLEEGAYIELFKGSDAMIHDCDSFTIEYMYTRKPVLYIDNGKEHEENLNSIGRKAFNLHYHARTEVQIEEFINNILEDKDPYRPMRNDFYNNFLSLPFGKSAADNIIEAILGENHFQVLPFVRY